MRGREKGEDTEGRKEEGGRGNEKGGKCEGGKDEGDGGRQQEGSREGVEEGGGREKEGKRCRSRGREKKKIEGKIEARKRGKF